MREEIIKILLNEFILNEETEALAERTADNLLEFLKDKLSFEAVRDAFPDQFVKEDILIEAELQALIKERADSLLMSEEEYVVRTISSHIEALSKELSELKDSE